MYLSLTVEEGIANPKGMKSKSIIRANKDISFSVFKLSDQKYENSELLVIIYYFSKIV